MVKVMLLRWIGTGGRAAVVGAAVLLMTGCGAIGGGGGSLQANDIDRQNVQKTLFEAAREAELKNNYAMAANLYGRLFENNPTDSALLSAFIRNMRYTGRSREVVDYVQRNAVALLDNAPAQFEFAKALLAAGRKSEAFAALNETLVLMPDNWQVYSALGIAEDALKRYDAAIAAYSTALKLSPDNVVVMNNMAMSQAVSGQLSAAISTLERAAGVNRNNVNVRQNLALLYAIDGDVDRARTLTSMDLDVRDVETNMTFYRRFESPVESSRQ